MRRVALNTVCAAWAMGLIALIVSQTVSAQRDIAQPGATAARDVRPDKPKKNEPGVQPYNPYPPGVLPADVTAELERVRREIHRIFEETLVEWRELPPPTVTGNPPKLQGSGYDMVRVLGKLMNYDENISVFKNMACSSCHMPYAGFGGPIPSVNLLMIAYPGSFRFRAGKRTPPRYTYSPEFPVLNYNEEQGAFFGGNFWDGRSTGYKLQSPDAEQAQHPPLDSQEHGLPDSACIAYRLSQAVYRPLFTQVWGKGSFDIKWPHDTEEICSTPAGAAIFDGNPEPIRLGAEDRLKANAVYDHWGQTISFLESSPEVSAFSSKFDAFLKGNYTLTPDEQAGYDLFRGKANCNSCHLDGRGSTFPGVDTSVLADTRPLFTCLGFANLGLPINPRDAFFYQTTPDSFGFTPNPYGFAYRDLGLGTFLRSGFGAGPNPNGEWTQFAPASDGMFQVSTARNVAMTPAQCPTTEAPGPYFQKAFFHNGYIKSLKQLVHFYNTRDVYPFPVTSGHCPPGTVEKVNCWPMPEVPATMDTTIGRLGLTEHEENMLVKFLETLTDGFTRPYPDTDKYTGTCRTGGSAATQGNEFLIPTPPLPPCTSAVCGVEPLPLANPPIR